MVASLATECPAHRLTRDNGPDSTRARGRHVTHIVIIGGGPAGYEAALVAAQLSADVTLVEDQGIGGACVLYDCVPSKTFIATSETMAAFRGAGALGVRSCDPGDMVVDAPVVHTRVKDLARAQSVDIHDRLIRE